MKNSFLQLSYTDNIRAEIQKEEILKIINAQKKKNKLQHTQRFKMKNPEESGKSGLKRRTMNNFSIRTKRNSEEKTRKYDSKLKMGMNISEQKAYFSVKHSYQKMIHSLRDEEIVKQLREQLNLSPTNKNITNPPKQESSNYFEKILGNTNKSKPQQFYRYFMIKKLQKQEEYDHNKKMMETSMNFYRYF